MMTVQVPWVSFTHSVARRVVLHHEVHYLTHLDGDVSAIAGEGVGNALECSNGHRGVLFRLVRHAVDCPVQCLGVPG
eukprot:1576302-Rhodomonas_salina.1